MRLPRKSPSRSPLAPPSYSARSWPWSRPTSKACDAAPQGSTPCCARPTCPRWTPKATPSTATLRSWTGARRRAPLAFAAPSSTSNRSTLPDCARRSNGSCWRPMPSPGSRTPGSPSPTGCCPTPIRCESGIPRRAAYGNASFEPWPPGPRNARGTHCRYPLGRHAAGRFLMAVAIQPLLSDALLKRCARERPMYDRENRFFRKTSTICATPAIFAWRYPRVRRLRPHACRSAAGSAPAGAYAPATALGLNMHDYWVGMAADLWRAGDARVEWILRGGRQGEVFAAGHAESGNETSLFIRSRRPSALRRRLSPSPAASLRQPRSGLDAVWHSRMDTSDPRPRKSSMRFMPRETPGSRSSRPGM